jgi:23S rRNA (uracil1939-C5)-methyltransferase
MPNDVFTVQIEGIAAGGAGFARIDGKSVFIEGTAPGETVCCRIVEERRSWARAGLLEIVEASPERVQPACARYGTCGGCNLQHLHYAAQLAAKTAILTDTFARIGGVNPPAPAVSASPPWEYRNRMQLHCIPQLRYIPQPQSGRQFRNIRQLRRGAAGGGFGLKARHSDAVVAVADCPVADPGIRALLRQAASGQPAMPSAAPVEQDRFTVYARDGLLLSEGGQRRGKTRLLEKEIALDAGVFFQSNGAMLEKLLADLRETAAAADRSRAMADLYCGVGTFACFLGDLFPRVDLVEEHRAALTLARENLRAAVPQTTAEYFALRDDAWAALQTRGRAARYGFIVVDPPRQGLAPALARWLAEAGPPLLAYVSCDPATLARDSKILLGGGYALTGLRFYDFYPQTAHIESLAVFGRNQPKIKQ